MFSSRSGRVNAVTRSTCAILGRDYSDAYEATLRHLEIFRDSLDSPLLLGAASLPSTLAHSVEGRRISCVYLTERAHLGLNYKDAYEILARCMSLTVESPKFVVLGHPITYVEA